MTRRLTQSRSLAKHLRETNIIPSKPLPEAMLQRGCDQHVVLLPGGTALAMLKESLSEGLCRPNSVMRLSEPLDPASSFAVFWPLNSDRIGANWSRRHDAAATNNKPLRIKLPLQADSANSPTLHHVRSHLAEWAPTSPSGWCFVEAAHKAEL